MIKNNIISLQRYNLFVMFFTIYLSPLYLYFSINGFIPFFFDGYYTIFCSFLLVPLIVHYCNHDFKFNILSVIYFLIILSFLITYGISFFLNDINNYYFIKISILALLYYFVGRNFNMYQVKYTKYFIYIILFSLLPFFNFDNLKLDFSNSINLGRYQAYGGLSLVLMVALLISLFYLKNNFLSNYFLIVFFGICCGARADIIFMFLLISIYSFYHKNILGPLMSFFILILVIFIADNPDRIISLLYLSSDLSFLGRTNYLYSGINSIFENIFLGNYILGKGPGNIHGVLSYWENYGLITFLLVTALIISIIIFSLYIYRDRKFFYTYIMLSSYLIYSACFFHSDILIYFGLIVGLSETVNLKYINVNSSTLA
jgi:hypothetical protein